MSDVDEPTEPTEPVEPAAPVAAPAAAPDPVHTVGRRAAAAGAAGALLLGVLLGWLGTRAFDDDDDAVPVSAFQQGGFPGPQGGYGPDGGYGPRGGPMGPQGPMGDWEGGRPPWDGERGHDEAPDESREDDQQDD